MAKYPKEPTDAVSIRLPVSLREDLRLLAKADHREYESDYWRKVLWEHVEDAKRSGKLPLESQTLVAIEGGAQ